ncbi:MAG: hypothetical protein E7289_05635 [Lachnospiraceae bacterium]|nr:hypothetical protein [Lachnospiraceae bacterium]
MLSLFHTSLKKDKWAEYLYEDMKQAEEKYVPYAVYFQKLATIRHDFANYMQSIQFFWMDEEAAAEGKRMKQHIVVLIDDLMEDTYKEMERKYLEKNNFERCPSFHDYEKMDVVLSRRWKSWFLKRNYFEAMYKEIPRMYMILRQMKDKLTYSMDPDERECEDMLKVLDSFRDKTHVQHPVLAALIADIDAQCHAGGIEFRYKAEVPDTFEIQITDVYYIYDTLLVYALGQAKKGTVGKQEIRFRTASQYGLWHLSMECPPGASLMDKDFYRVLKKYKITYKYKCVDGKTQIDLIH